MPQPEDAIDIKVTLDTKEMSEVIDEAIKRINQLRERANELSAENSALKAKVEGLETALTAMGNLTKDRIMALETDGTPLARITDVCHFAEARGLCTGMEAKPGELFLMEAYDRVVSERNGRPPVTALSPSAGMPAIPDLGRASGPPEVGPHPCSAGCRNDTGDETGIHGANNRCPACPY